jgi:hypothetical protein
MRKAFRRGTVPVPSPRASSSKLCSAVDSSREAPSPFSLFVCPFSSIDIVPTPLLSSPAAPFYSSLAYFLQNKTDHLHPVVGCATDSTHPRRPSRG